MLYKQLIATLNTSKALLVTGAVPYTWLSTEECNGWCWEMPARPFRRYEDSAQPKHKGLDDWRLPKTKLMKQVIWAQI